MLRNKRILIQYTHFIRANSRPDGTVYKLPEVGRGVLQCIETGPTAYQANNLHIQRKFVLGTVDGSPKKDLVLTRAAMLKPLDFATGRFKVGSVVLPDPCNWHSLSENQELDGFDEEVEVISSEDLIQQKRARLEPRALARLEPRAPANA